MTDISMQRKTSNSYASQSEKLVSQNPTNYSSPSISIDGNDKNIPLNNFEIDEQKEDLFYTKNAHRVRRIYHVIIFSIVPIIYFWTAKDIANALQISISKILSFLILLTIIIEFIRIKQKCIIFGMREYERNHISAQSWGTISSFIVLLLAYPRTYSISPVIITDINNKSIGSEAYSCFGQIAIPIIWTLGFGDPLLGELKKYARNNIIKTWIMYIIVYVILFIIWILCYFWCGTPWWLSIIIPPIAIIAEKPSIIDDNGLMLLVPLLFTLIFEPWFNKQCDQIFYS